MQSVKATRVTGAWAAAWLAVAIVAGPAAAEEFGIGSKAPPIDIEHWLQDRGGAFKPVTELPAGKVSVIEFWATWCPPCVASMPHIAALQDAYADKGVTIISVSNEDLKTVEEFLDRKAEGERTFRDVTKGYCLTTDPDGSVFKDYLDAARIGGLPTAFIVGTTGEIEWIGHPGQMDEPLEQVVAGSWDRAAHLAEKKERDAIQGRLALAGQLLKGDDPTQAVALVDELIAGAVNERVKAKLGHYRKQVATAAAKTVNLRAVKKGGPEAVAAFGRMVTAAGDSSDPLNEAAWRVVELVEKGADVSADLLAAARAAAEKAAGYKPENADVLDTLAHLQAAQGDLAQAIVTEKKALEHAAGPAADEIRKYLEALELKALEAKANAALLHANPPDATVPTEPSIADKAIEKPTPEAMRSLAKSICDGDKKAFDVLCVIEKELVRDRVPGSYHVILAAYELLGQEAAKGNKRAFDALKTNMGMSTRGLHPACAVRGMGIAAAGGHKEALDILHKEALNTLRKHNEDGLLLSTTVGELVAPASANIEPAVEFLIKVLRKPRAMPLHQMASEGLKGAARMGNAQAKAALDEYVPPKAEDKPAIPVTLKVGDLAPKLSVGEWVQGDPVQAFEKDKVYLVEFWATWCGPCVASIPHLNEVHLKYKDKGLVVIGQNVSEENARVKGFVTTMGDKMSYRVASDDLSKSERGAMGETWLRAAGLEGLPAAFLVGKTGEIEWIGHPGQMDEPLEQVVAGSWDRAAHLAEKKERDAIQGRLALAGRLLQGDDPSQAVALVDELIAGAVNERVKAKLGQYRKQVAASAAKTVNLRAVKKGGPEAVAAFGRMVTAAGDAYDPLNEAAWRVVELVEKGADVSADLLAAARAAAEKAAGYKPENADVLDTLAHLQAAQGDLAQAIATEEKALVHATGPAADEIRKYLKALELKLLDAKATP